MSVLIIAGPTASGKTRLGTELAKRLDAKTEPVLGVSNQMKAGGEK